MKIKLFLGLMTGTVLLISCQTIQYKTKTIQSLPELGTLGVFEKYIGQKIINEKSVVEIDTPLKIKVEKVIASKRAIFINKDSTNLSQGYLTLEILDKFSFLDRINKNKDLIGYLKSNSKVRVVTEVDIEFSKVLSKEILEAQELYLVQNKQKTLSLELRNNNKPFKTIEFSEGTIRDFKPSEFCWGAKKRYKVQILDLVDIGTDCSKETFKTYKKAERKTDTHF